VLNEHFVERIHVGKCLVQVKHQAMDLGHVHLSLEDWTVQKNKARKIVAW